MRSVMPYRIFAVGDNALTIDFGNVIDENINRQVLHLFALLRKNPLQGMIEAVPAYSSLTVYYDIGTLHNNRQTAYEAMKRMVKEKLQLPLTIEEVPANRVTIPVCYDPDFAPGIGELAAAKNISAGEIVSIHTARPYRVFMLGFLPGFPYMGEVDERIAIPRKTKPEPVAAGSVGIAGKQTGIYPLHSPGGWCIIGRTPLQLFAAGNENFTLLQAGDIVQFISISKDEFAGYQSRHT